MKLRISKAFILIALIQLLTSGAQAQGLAQFLNRCLWGTALGAGAGFVTLVASDQPGDSWGNVARGASLGLYGGIAYGVYKHNQPAPSYSSEYALVPVFSEGRVDGLQFTGTLFSF